MRLNVAEARDGVLCPAGQVRFGFAGKGFWHLLDERRAGASSEERHSGASWVGGRNQVLWPAQGRMDSRRRDPVRAGSDAIAK